MASEKSPRCAGLLCQFQTCFTKAFEKLGQVIARFPWPFLILPVVVAVICGFGFLKFSEVTDIYEQYTPEDSQAYHELQMSKQFRDKKGVKPPPPSLRLPVVIESRNDSNLLYEPVPELLDFFETEFTAEYKGQNYTFQDICRPFCGLNNPTKVMYRAIKLQEETDRSDVKLTYPTLEFLSAKVNIRNHIYAVETDENGVMVSVSMIQALFNVRKRGEHVQVWFDAFYEYLLENKDPRFIFYTVNQKAIEDDVRETGLSALPYVAISFALVLIFAIVSTRGTWSIVKLVTIVIGVLSPFLPLTVSFGLLLFCGIGYQPIVTVSLFLVLAVALNDLYVQLHFWYGTDPTLTTSDRLSETMRKAAPGITITALTNALAYGIGMSVKTPAVQSFCLFTCIAVVVSYLCQLSFVSSVLAISTKWKKPKVTKSCFDSNHLEHLRKFKNVMARALSSWVAKVIVGLLVVAYWAVAAYGWTQITMDLSLEKLVLSHSNYHTFRDVQTTYFEHTPEITVFINRPPNLTKPEEQQLVHDLVHEFEFLDPKYNVPNTTRFWLPAYMDLVNLFTEDFTYRYIPNFVKSGSNVAWGRNLNFWVKGCKMDHRACLRKFSFQTTYTGLTNWTTRIDLLARWRAIVNKQKYKHLRATVFYSNSFLCDQISSVASTTRNAIVFSLSCMILVCLLLVPNLISVLCGVGAVLSINFGLLGLLILWSVDLDPISMAALLMALGFSVNFTAHVTYSFGVVDRKLSPSEKLQSVLDAIAWPVLQAAVSTLLCVSVLVAHQSYLIITFVKTVVLVVILGLFHGLLVLPVLLSSLLSIKCGGKVEDENL